MAKLVKDDNDLGKKFEWWTHKLDASHKSKYLLVVQSIPSVMKILAIIIIK